MGGMLFEAIAQNSELGKRANAPMFAKHNQKGLLAACSEPLRSDRGDRLGLDPTSKLEEGQHDPHRDHE